MRFMNIASGSGGNATYIGSNDTHILIDAGISRKRIQEGLNKLDLSINDITAILISHEHTDHVSSLCTVERSCRVPVYATEGTFSALKDLRLKIESDDLLNIIQPEEEFMIGDIKITAVRTSHDAKEPVCFRLETSDSSCAVITDLGVYDEKLINNMLGLNLVLIESNHDRRMLEAGPYPYPLKLRIAGDKGHLSNESSGRLLSGLLNDRMKHIILGHLSEKNNSKDLAKLTVINEINEHSGFNAGDFRIDIADQKNGSEIYSF